MKYKKIFIGVLMLLGSTMMVMSGCSSRFAGWYSFSYLWFLGTDGSCTTYQ